MKNTLVLIVCTLFFGTVSQANAAGFPDKANKPDQLNSTLKYAGDGIREKQFSIWSKNGVSELLAQDGTLVGEFTAPIVAIRKEPAKGGERLVLSLRNEVTSARPNEEHNSWYATTHLHEQSGMRIVVHLRNANGDNLYDWIVDMNSSNGFGSGEDVKCHDVRIVKDNHIYITDRVDYLMAETNSVAINLLQDRWSHC